MKYYYRFVYKDVNGKLGYTIVNIDKQDNELAIAQFEKTFPDLVWRRFEEIKDMKATLKAVITDIPKSHEVDVTFYVQKEPGYFLGPLVHPYSDQVFSVRYLNRAKAYAMTSTGDCDVILHAMFPEGFVINKWEFKDYPPINHCSIEESLSAIPLEVYPMCVVVAHYRSQNHSFPVAIFSNDVDAISCANQYTQYRGNRVYCTVDKIDVNAFDIEAEIKTEIYSTLLCQ